MARPHLLPAQTRFREAETRASIDELIRPGLSRAFPLPAGTPADHRFSQLLGALAQVKSGTSQATQPRRASAS
jgi:hypothetical protein